MISVKNEANIYLYIELLPEWITLLSSSKSFIRTFYSQHPHQVFLSWSHFVCFLFKSRLISRFSCSYIASIYPLDMRYHHGWVSRSIANKCTSLLRFSGHRFSGNCEMRIIIHCKNVFLFPFNSLSINMQFAFHHFFESIFAFIAARE